MAAKKKEATEKASAPAKEAKKTPAKAAPEMEGSSKLAQFLAAKKLDARRLLVASKKLEGLRPEDRMIKLQKRRPAAASGGEGGGEGGEAAKKEPPKKPRSGRPVTWRALAAAMKGAPLSGPTKTRILRAVNHLLEQKKGEKVDLKTLF